MKVFHVITGLGQGGAESVLLRLVAASTGAIEHTVVSLTGDLHYADRIRTLGIGVHALDIRGPISFARRLPGLKRLVSIARPDVVQTWMYHADLIGGIAARWAGARTIVWGVRHSRLDRGKSSRSALMAARACARLSRWLPAAIVSCSEEAAREHKRIGYAADRIVVIRNGCDLSRFKPEPEAGAQLRAGWSVKQDEILIGTVARWDPYKDHENLFRALALLRERGRPLRCVLVGKGMEAGNLELTRMIGKLDLADRVILAGPREDIPAVMSAFDLHVLSSCGEAFPNTVAEAMACGTPCVVTNVGDAAEIVGECGWVAPPNDASALAQSIDSALNTLASGERAALVRRCRSRIEEHFGLDRMVSAYHDLWTELVRENAGAR